MPVPLALVKIGSLVELAAGVVTVFVQLKRETTDKEIKINAILTNVEFFMISIITILMRNKQVNRITNYQYNLHGHLKVLNNSEFTILLTLFYFNM